MSHLHSSESHCRCVGIIQYQSCTSFIADKQPQTTSQLYIMFWLLQSSMSITDFIHCNKSTAHPITIYQPPWSFHQHVPRSLQISNRKQHHNSTSCFCCCKAQYLSLTSFIATSQPHIPSQFTSHRGSFTSMLRWSESDIPWHVILIKTSNPQRSWKLINTPHRRMQTGQHVKKAHAVTSDIGGACSTRECAFQSWSCACQGLSGSSVHNVTCGRLTKNSSSRRNSSHMQCPRVMNVSQAEHVVSTLVGALQDLRRTDHMLCHIGYAASASMRKQIRTQILPCRDTADKPHALTKRSPLPQPGQVLLRIPCSI